VPLKGVNEELFEPLVRVVSSNELRLDSSNIACQSKYKQCWKRAEQRKIDGVHIISYEESGDDRYINIMTDI
jgi:hypothetical protein